MRRAMLLTACFLACLSIRAARAADAADVRLLEVRPGTELEIRILPSAAPSPAAEPHRIGRVEISRRGEPKPFQTLEVTGNGTSRHLASFSRFEDVNFDGYADLLLGHDGGAKWVGYEVYLYDPASGTFVQNDLSRDMSERLTGQTLDFERAASTIRLTHLPFGCQNGFVASETFVIQGAHLKKVEQQDDLRAKDGCYTVTRRVRDGGGLEEVSRERVARAG